MDRVMTADEDRRRTMGVLACMPPRLLADRYAALSGALPPASPVRGPGEVGHAVVLGRDADHARRAAHLDAVWQRPEWRRRIEDDIVAPGLAAEAAATRGRAEETEATRVDFFTLVRGED